MESPPPLPSPLPLLPAVHAAKVTGIVTGAQTSILDAVLRSRRRGWRQASQAAALARGSHTLGAAALVALESQGRTLQSLQLPCPCCKVALAAELPDGITSVQCSSCQASFYAAVAPPRVRRERPERNANGRVLDPRPHHRRPATHRRNDRTSSGTSAWRKRLSEEMPRILQEAGVESGYEGPTLSSQAAMKAVGRQWQTEKRMREREVAEAAQGTRRRQRRR